MGFEELRAELKKSIDEKIDTAISEHEQNKTDIDIIRSNLLEAIADKKTNRSEVSRVTGLGYITIINVLNPDYKFEVKQSTLQKIQKYLDDMA